MHSHVFEDVPEVVEMMDRCRVRIVNVCVRGTDPERLRRQEELAERQQAKYGRNRFPFASTFDVTRRDDPDYVDQVTRWLDASFEKGAVMVKIWKEVGMEIKDRQGRFVLPDDPLFDPVYAFLAKRGKPLLAHLAEPLDAWRPLDPESVHYGYYSKNPEWHLHGRSGFPSHAELVASRDRILERHPRLTVIGAHLGSLEHDVEELARRLERYPNFSVDCSARTADLTRQPPDKVRAFLVRHQDRVLYGLDRSYRPDPQRETHGRGSAPVRPRARGVVPAGLPVLRGGGRDGVPGEDGAVPRPSARGPGEALPPQRGEAHPGPGVRTRSPSGSGIVES